MWMVMDSNNDHSPEFNKLLPDTVIGRKLRPLMPRPLSSSSTPYSTPSCCCIRNPNILSWNHSISDEGVNREIEVVSTRWNPTPEQLQLLEEMYRRGIRTPSADQIQQIATKLGRFGKIQGKNVFYWFQNHKARDRQKKRRQLRLLAGKNTHTNHQTPPPPSLDAAGGVMSNRSYLEIEHIEKKKKKVVSTASNCSILALEEDDSASMHGAVIAAAGKNEWNHKELRQSPTAENEIRWQLHFDSSSNSSSNSNTNRRLGQENTKPYHPINFNFHNQHQTLDLFPNPPPLLLQQYIPPHLTKITPTQFIEFLPIIKS